MLPGRRRFLIALLGLAAVGCDAKDPERLGRVGKKVAERGRRAADEARLPKVTVVYPDEPSPNPK